MKWEEALRRSKVAHALRDIIADDKETLPCDIPVSVAASGAEMGVRTLTALLSHGPVSCGSLLFYFDRKRKVIVGELGDDENMRVRAALVVQWRAVLETHGFEAALEAIQGYNLKSCDITLKLLHGGVDGWFIDFEDVNGEGASPSEALVQALRRWVFCAPVVPNKPSPIRRAKRHERKRRGARRRST
jgi:hypothetical protein